MKDEVSDVVFNNGGVAINVAEINYFLIKFIPSTGNQCYIKICKRILRP